MRRTVKSNKSCVRRPAEAEGASPGVRSVSSSCSKQLSSGDVTPGQLSLSVCPVVCCVQSVSSLWSAVGTSCQVSSPSLCVLLLVVSSLCPACGQQWGRHARSALPPSVSCCLLCPVCVQSVVSSGDITPGQLSLSLCLVVCCVQCVSSLWSAVGMSRQVSSSSLCVLFVVSSLCPVCVQSVVSSGDVRPGQLSLSPRVLCLLCPVCGQLLACCKEVMLWSVLQDQMKS